MSRFALTPCLVLTFLFGPIGYLVLRLATGEGVPAVGGGETA